jgi:hypothetical protein
MEPTPELWRAAVNSHMASQELRVQHFNRKDGKNVVAPLPDGWMITPPPDLEAHDGAHSAHRDRWAGTAAKHGGGSSESRGG